MRVAEAKRHGTPNRRRVVTVVGSGKVADGHCAEVGRLIASLGYDLLTGGGRGVMEAVSRAFYETSPRKGLVIGVVPGEIRSILQVEARRRGRVDYHLPPGYPNPWVEIAIYTHLPDSGTEGTLRSSRNHLNVLSADAIVALPGRAGTEAEIWLATEYAVPIVAYGEHGELPRGVPRASSLDEIERFLKESIR